MKKWHYFTKRRWQHQPLLLLFSYAPLCRISNGRHKTILTMKDLTQVATICQRGGGGVERDEKVYSLFTALAPHCCCKNKKIDSRSAAFGLSCSLFRPPRQREQK